MALLAVEALTLRHDAVVALREVSLSVSAGEVLCLLGPSGSGKSSLLRLVAGVERPTSGRVLLDGVEVAGPRAFVEPERRRVGMVFQDYALFPHLSVRANVAFGLRAWGRAEANEVVRTLLERLELTRHEGSYPHMLSGGERQRVALARALAPRPRVLLMDEPFSSLDGRLREHVRRQTMELLRDLQTTTLLVTHDPQEAARVADRIALLHAGRLVQCGPPEALYQRPATPFAASFFGEVNLLAGVCRSGRVDTPLGSFDAAHLPEGAPCNVCIRPHHLRIAGADGIRAQVLRSEFLGEAHQLLLSVSGLSSPLLLRTPERAGLSPGDTTCLELHARDVFVVANDDSLPQEGNP